MARGFESKDVEFQQAEATRPRTTRPALTAEQRATQTKRRTLELALANARAQRDRSTNPQHLSMLDAAIQSLEEQLESLQS
jgi:hypothetical protein